MFSIHCLSRWFQRSGGRSYSDLVADIGPLVAARDAPRIVTEAGGVWLVNVTTTRVGDRVYRVLACRSFLHADMLVTPRKDAAA